MGHFSLYIPKNCRYQWEKACVLLVNAHSDFSFHRPFLFKVYHLDLRINVSIWILLSWQIRYQLPLLDGAIAKGSTGTRWHNTLNKQLIAWSFWVHLFLEDLKKLGLDRAIRMLNWCDSNDWSLPNARKSKVLDNKKEI
jgi:hypothetical protein